MTPAPALPRLGLPATIIGVAAGIILTAIGVVFGFIQGVSVQIIILSAIATLAAFVWGWRFVLGQFTGSGEPVEEGQISEGRRVWLQFRPAIYGLLVLLALFLILSLTIDGFFNVWNIVSFLIILTIIVLTRTLGRHFQENRSAFIGIMVLCGLFSIGSMNIEGFASANNIKSMLLFASFLGIASVGQTLVALLGGLDLSIPFIIGAANVGLLYLIGLGVPPWLAAIIVLAVGTLLGVINGFLSYRLQGQALIVTLGTGFAISGGVQIITSIGSAYSGNVFGQVPPWLSNLAAMNGTTFGLPFPPVIAIWALVLIVLIAGMRLTVYGRYL